MPVVRDVAVSFGLLSANLRDDSLANIIARADKALYLAKHLGRNRVEIISSMLL